MRPALLVMAFFCALLAGAMLSAQTPSQGPLQQARDLVEWGRLKEARTLLLQASTDAGNDKNAPLLAYLGHLQVQFGDLDAASQLTKQALKLDQNCATCHLYRFEAMAKHAETMNQVRALLALHGIKKQLEKAERLAPNLGDVQWGWIQLDLSLPAAVGGSTQAALQHADLLSRIDPVDGHLARASIFESEGHPDQALAEYRAAAQQHPNDPRGVFALGKALYLRADYAGAAAPLERAWNLNHASALYGAYHAANLVRLQRPLKARTVLLAAQKLHPDSRLGDFLAAQALADTGQDFPWAKQLLERYLAVPPEPGQASSNDAQRLLQQVSSTAAGDARARSHG